MRLKLFNDDGGRHARITVRPPQCHVSAMLAVDFIICVLNELGSGVLFAEGRKSLSVNIDIKPKKSLEEPAEPMKRPVETGEHHQPAVKKFKSWS